MCNGLVFSDLQTATETISDYPKVWHKICEAFKWKRTMQPRLAQMVFEFGGTKGYILLRHKDVRAFEAA